MKLTEKRKKILDVLENSGKTLSASEIFSKVENIDLATVYRTLDFFEKENLVNKYIFGEKEFFYEIKKENHQHAFCTDCQKVLHFDLKDEDLLKLIKIKNFDVKEVEVIVKGKCKNN